MKSPVDDGLALKPGQGVGKMTRSHFAATDDPKRRFIPHNKTTGREAMYFGIGGLILLIIILVLLFR